MTTGNSTYRIILFILAAGLLSTGARAACLDGGYTINVDGIIDVVAHPTEADTLFVLQTPADPGGVSLLKSCDNGATWSPTALTYDFYTVYKLAVDPTSPETVYAATSQSDLVSTDGGITWTETDLPGFELVFAADGTLYSYDVDRVYRRLPGSTTWTQMTSVPRNIDVLRVHPADSSRLHTGRHYSVDGGASWQAALGETVYDLRYSPSEPDRLVAATMPLALSQDGGVNWAEPPYAEFSYFNTSSPGGRFVAFDASDADTIYVATNNCALWRSTDGGQNWSTADGGMTGTADNCPVSGAHPRVTRFLPSPAHGDRFYATTSDGLFVTSDDGATWEAINGTPGTEVEPPPNPFSGSADMSVTLSGVPRNFTPPTTIRFSAEVRQNGPDTARRATFSVQGDITSNYPGCSGPTCDFGDLPAGSVIRLDIARELLGGGSGTSCTGDVLEIRATVGATTEDPNTANNVAVAETTRQNSVSLISGCPGEGVLNQLDESGGGGGGSAGFTLLAGLIALVARRDRRRRPVPAAATGPARCP